MESLSDSEKDTLLAALQALSDSMANSRYRRAAYEG